MSLTMLLVGVAVQVLFAFFQFMMVVFSAAGTANTRDLTPGQQRILFSFMWLLPAISVATAAVLVVGYRLQASWLSHAWHAVPVVCAALYFAYALRLSRMPRSRMG